MSPVYSLVVPIYNEEAVLPILLRRLDALMDALDAPGGGDLRRRRLAATQARSSSRPRRAPTARYRFIRLSRNFGHQIAITTGMERASGEAVIVMDADLQDPPEVVLEMIAKWQQGYEIVYAERLSRDGESRFKRLTADLFYRLLAKLSDVEIPRNVGDFRLVDRRALDAFLAMPERDRFVRGMFAWIGFRQTVVQFHRPARAAGETKYSLAKMIRLAANGVVSFSDAPLRLALWAGLAFSGLAILYGLWVIAMWAMNADLARGWSSIIVLTAFLGGANMLMTGVMGVYVGRIYGEVKRRPLYVIDRAVGLRSRGARNAGARRACPPPGAPEARHGDVRLSRPPPPALARRGCLPRWALVAAIGLAAIGLQLHFGLLGDVSWLITVDEKWLDGETPYLDFIEINPPASLMLYWPAVALARLIGVAPEFTVAAFRLPQHRGKPRSERGDPRPRRPARTHRAGRLRPSRWSRWRSCRASPSTSATNSPLLYGLPFLALAAARAARGPVDLPLAIVAGLGAGVDGRHQAALRAGRDRPRSLSRSPHRLSRAARLRRILCRGGGRARLCRARRKMLSRITSRRSAARRRALRADPRTAARRCWPARAPLIRLRARRCDGADRGARPRRRRWSPCLRSARSALSPPSSCRARAGSIRSIRRSR